MIAWSLPINNRVKAEVIVDLQPGSFFQHLFMKKCAHILLEETSLLENFYWDSQMAKTISVLKPRSLRNLLFFSSVFLLQF